LVISGRHKTDPEIVHWIADFLTGPKKAYLQHLVKSYSYRIRVKGALRNNSQKELKGTPVPMPLGDSNINTKFRGAWIEFGEEEKKGKGGRR